MGLLKAIKENLHHFCKDCEAVVFPQTGGKKFEFYLEIRAAKMV